MEARGARYDLQSKIIKEKLVYNIRVRVLKHTKTKLVYNLPKHTKSKHENSACRRWVHPVETPEGSHCGYIYRGEDMVSVFPEP